MRKGEEASTHRAWNWLKRRLPFLVVTVSPLLTVPLGALLLLWLGGEREAEALGLPPGDLCRFEGHIAQTCFYYFDFWRTGLLLAAPGALNLLAALWFLNRNGYVRVAAVVALVLGVARTLIVPLATIAVSQIDVVSDGGLFFRVEVEAAGVVRDVTSPSEGRAVRQVLTAVWVGGAVFWGITVLVWRAYEPLMARYWRNLDPPGGPRLDAPPRWTGFLRRR